MKTLKVALLVLFLCAAAYPQTQDLGLGAYANEKGPIILAVDASMVMENMKSPYVLFIVYMAAKGDKQSIAVNRNDVTMIYKDQEYKMPSVEELRKNYGAEIRDIDFYRHLSEGGMVSSWIKFYRFPSRADFFPPLRAGAGVPVDEGSMSDSIGFRTKCYFKNPGFEKGDKLTIKVRDKKNPDLTGEVEVTLK